MVPLAQKDISAKQFYEKLKNVSSEAGVASYPLEKCEELLERINKIIRLKEEKNAVILVHSYAVPEIIYGVGDFVGDSYKLSLDAKETGADKIVFAAVRFMGETAKILNPRKDVLIPGRDNGCSLADSISAETVLGLKRQFRGYTFVCYINTTIEVKAQCDVCVTSANYIDVVQAIPSDKIYFLPDRSLGENLKAALEKRGVRKDIRYYNGGCHVHERFTLDQIQKARREYPDIDVVSHPECGRDVCRASDFVGSTSQIFEYVKKSGRRVFFVMTESGLVTRLQVEMPDKKFVGTRSECEYMKSNTLDDILRVLTNPLDSDRVVIPEELRRRALICLEAMFKYTKK